ncbi:alpha/beta hydrolase [Prosthecobacter sp.]|uniref:alpha/beta hydrolase n=1 Tax=Prosthecobacter sp. TaxID=1965333 RepID=UPI002AB84204|nr:alpha/beta hydrolase [Prosthecobacter sp.]MDZ4402160.1 alpha/beta hydrolase [Prosthecobacter sp.]
MPLDPQAQAFLAQLAALGAPPLEQLPVDQVRAIYRQLFGGSGEPEAVGEVIDRTIPGPGGPIPLRIYTPKGSGPFPVLVHLHGGGWVVGDLAAYDPICRKLTNAAGCAVVSVDYRLAPEHKFPAALDDCYAALQWVAANAPTFHGDASRIAVGGDSAGGTLSAVVAQQARDEGGPRLCYQLLIYPVTNYGFNTPSYRENADGYLLTKNLMAWFWGHYLRSESDGSSPKASPLRSPNLGGLPPALVITAEFDPLRDEGEAYASQLRDAGVSVTLKRYDGMIHGFFGLSGALAQGQHAVAEAAAGLRAAFREKTPGI